MARVISDPFFRQLNARLQGEIENRIYALTEGGSSVHGDRGLLLDPVNTAIKYKEDIAIIKTYRDVIELCFEIDREVFGTKHTEEGDD